MRVKVIVISLIPFSAEIGSLRMISAGIRSDVEVDDSKSKSRFKEKNYE
jgi:hypothetical protein